MRVAKRRDSSSVTNAVPGMPAGLTVEEMQAAAEVALRMRQRQRRRRRAQASHRDGGAAANWVEGAGVPAMHLNGVRTIVQAIAADDNALRGLTLTAVPGETGVFQLFTATSQRAAPEVYSAVLAAATQQLGSSAFETHLGSRAVLNQCKAPVDLKNWAN
ncbi:hypothetical protein JKP88DRAFT_273537 [Tribonema minus]|uniref:Uncharacterized protein n=1 Tax=Tribonema minus TaxID=303371 RepID=A0A836CBL0_9STRA|nr:hypothetical protein JKP88DRAFT_273537 [Tribonema minus]